MTFGTLAYNAGQDLIPLSPGDTDSLTEAPDHQAGGAGCTGKRVEPREPQMKGARPGLKQP